MAGISFVFTIAPHFLHFTACPTHCTGMRSDDRQRGQVARKEPSILVSGRGRFLLDSILADSVPRIPPDPAARSCPRDAHFFCNRVR